MSPSVANAQHETKFRILDAAEAIMTEKGFHGVGLNEVLKAVGVPKGSFYHWFPSKEVFGVELIRYYCDDATQFRRRHLGAESGITNAHERLMRFFQIVLERFEKGGCGQMCLVMKLSMEVASISEPMREVLAEAQQEWLSLYESLIIEGQKNGQITKMTPAGELAAMVFDLWFGTLSRCIVLKSSQPLHQVLRQVETLIKI